MTYVCVELDELAEHCIEWAAQNALVVPSLSVTDGAQLGMAVGLVWATAWAARMIYRTIINR